MIFIQTTKGQKKHYREAIRLNPEDSKAHSNLALILEDRYVHLVFAYEAADLVLGVEFDRDGDGSETLGREFIRHFLLAIQFFTRIPITGKLADWVGFSPAMLRASAAHCSPGRWFSRLRC